MACLSFGLLDNCLSGLFHLFVFCLCVCSGKITLLIHPVQERASAKLSSEKQIPREAVLGFSGHREHLQFLKLHQIKMSQHESVLVQTQMKSTPQDTCQTISSECTCYSFVPNADFKKHICVCVWIKPFWMMVRPNSSSIQWGVLDLWILWLREMIDLEINIKWPTSNCMH